MAPLRKPGASASRSILVALLLGGLVMSIALPEGSNIFSAYGTIIEGALGKKTAIRQTIKLAVPLLGYGAGHRPVLQDALLEHRRRGPDHRRRHRRDVLFRAVLLRQDVPPPVLLLIMGVACGRCCGGLWALIPAFFKAKWNTNETLFTLMMNYIIIGVVKLAARAARGKARPSG